MGSVAKTLLHEFTAHHNKHLAYKNHATFDQNVDPAKKLEGGPTLLIQGGQLR